METEVLTRIGKACIAFLLMFAWFGGCGLSGDKPQLSGRSDSEAGLTQSSPYPSEQGLPSSAPASQLFKLPAVTLSPRLGSELSPQERPEPSSAPRGMDIAVKASPMIGLWIPRLDLKLAVKQVRLDSVPVNPPFNRSTVGHLVYQDTYRGSNPGTDATNATYIAGHTWRGGYAAFDTVDQRLRNADDIFVMTESSRRLGVWLHYVVTENHVWPQSQLPHEKSVWEVKPHLVLITCKLRSDGQHQSHNHVFFADLAGVVSSSKE